ncbi:MAG: hypothetical protein KF775_09170 [Cyclobacteriaceae bacterium]|nr:hypothetical protein [Cyclobacteriaceae bacterium]
MKKPVFILLAVLVACQAKKTDTETQSVAATAAAPSFFIALDPASQMISDYLVHPTLDLSRYTLGGVFPVSDFMPDNKNEGLLMWYCFDTSRKQIFMAIEPLHHYDTASLPKAPLQAILKKPEQTFLYTNPSPAPADVKDFILNQKLTGASANLGQAVAARYVKSFDSLMQKTQDAAGKSYQKYPLNYFIWWNDYKTFVSWAGTDGYIRYYYGFDEGHTPNRIRIVLIAADKNGNTITGAQARSEDGGGEGLQNGWPPPPFH